MDPRDVIIEPVVSEKSYANYDRGVYTFIVHPKATKTQIKHAIETVFPVKVTNVNTLRRKGKRSRNRRTGIWGQKKATKRAIVTLAPGDEIEIFGVA